MPQIRILVPDVLWTKALLDGKVRVEGFPALFEASLFDQRSSRRLRGELEERYDGAEQVLSDFIVRLSSGSEKNLIALPVFVTRGMVHRKLVMRRDSLAPKDLTGRAIGMGRVLGATSVFLRGLLAEEYGVERRSVRWVAAEPFTSDAAMGAEWAYLSERGNLRASNLIPKLAGGTLDAVLYPGGAGGHWFNWLVEGGASLSPDPYGDLEQIVKQSPALWFPIGDLEAHLNWFRRTRIYPLYHCLAIRWEIADKNLGLAGALVEAFDHATAKAFDYMTPLERSVCEREIDLLGVDPNHCGLNDLHSRTVEKCQDYLEADGLLPRRLTMQEIFPSS
jgi:4,5-dihydroxyphthalate decarboxylase